MSSPADNNPYTPPATLADESALPAPDPAAPPERPWQVVVAVWLGLVNLGIPFLVFFLYEPDLLSPRRWHEVWETLRLYFRVSPDILLGLTVIMGWILRGVWLGRSLARILYFLQFLHFLRRSEPADSAVAAFMHYSWLALSVASLWLVFLTSGRKWFRWRIRFRRRAATPQPNDTPP